MDSADSAHPLHAARLRTGGWIYVDGRPALEVKSEGAESSETLNICDRLLQDFREPNFQCREPALSADAFHVRISMSPASKIVVLAALLVVPSTSQVKVEGRGATRRFISQRYGFSMAVPRGWGVSIGLDTPVYFYAPPGERFIQASIPKGGAEITVGSHDTMPGPGKSATTPEAWALADAHAMASSLPSIRPFRFPKESGASDAVTCSYDEPTFSPDQRTQHSVAIFWKFSRKMFAAHLNYNARDSHVPAFEKTFFETIRSIRPLDRPHGRNTAKRLTE